jgi:urease accessory protein
MEICFHASAADEPLGRWRGELRLRFAMQGGRTVLRERHHRGPLQVQRLLYPEGGAPCHVMLLHPPGGLVAGDSLEVEVAVEAGARVLVTTPAAGKVYRAGGGGGAAQRQLLSVAAGGSLEWLPQETIAFAGADAELTTRVELEAGATFLGWEILCLGRPAAGEAFARGRCRQRFELWRDGRPLCLERASLEGGTAVMEAGWGLRGATVVGTLLATGRPFDPENAGRVPAASAVGATAQLRAILDEIRALPTTDLVSATVVGETLVCRYLGGSAERARAYLSRVWSLVRPALVGRPPCPPRIWST